MQDCHKNTHTNGEEHHGFGLTEVVLLSSDGFAAPDGDGFLRRKEEEKREVSAFAMDIIESRGHTHNTNNLPATLCLWAGDRCFG
jgi:hypothetical protein